MHTGGKHREKSGIATGDRSIRVAMIPVSMTKEPDPEPPSTFRQTTAACSANPFFQR
jgi:hypothetical protein